MSETPTRSPAGDDTGLVILILVLLAFLAAALLLFGSGWLQVNVN